MPTSLVEVDLTVDRALILRYARLTDDYNPIHIDPVFAAATPLGGVIAHGTMAVNLIWQALQATLGGSALSGVCLDIRFAKPVREHDRVTAGGQVRTDGSGYDVWVRNQNDICVIEGMARIPAR